MFTCARRVAASEPPPRTHTLLQGLPRTADAALLESQADQIVGKLLRARSLSSAIQDAHGLYNVRSCRREPHWLSCSARLLGAQDEGLEWMHQTSRVAVAWLGALPDQLPALAGSTGSCDDPLLRFFEREVAVGSSLLTLVRRDLEAVVAVCEGTRSRTTHAVCYLCRDLHDALYLFGALLRSMRWRRTWRRAESRPSGLHTLWGRMQAWPCGWQTSVWMALF